MKKLKVVFYRQDKPYTDGIQHNFFQYAIWEALSQLLGETTKVDLDNVTFIDIDNKDGFYFDPIEGDFDIAYSDKCVPTRKPAKFYFGIQSDWRGNQDRTTRWFKLAKPDALFNMYSPAQSLKDACANNNVRYEYTPWWIVTPQPKLVGTNRPIRAMSTGAMGTHYVWRTAFARALKQMGRADIFSMPKKNNVPYEKYLSRLAQCKYYCTGPTDDDDPKQSSIPHKYIEVCNYGCCLVAPDSPYMEAAGFIPNVNYIQCHDPNEISKIVMDDKRWIGIGAAGQEMVQRLHTVEKRAERILEIYKEMNSAD